MATPISIANLGAAYTQDFNALSVVLGSTTNNLTIPGWLLTETGGGTRDNEQYAVDDGGSNVGDAYAYGTGTSSDRALGTLRSGADLPTIGAAFTNDTGVAITSLDIAYTGELWRQGGVSQQDTLNFQYSLDATDLSNGTWISVNALDFSTPNIGAPIGATDGNIAANRTALSTTISGLNIVPGATFLIRWTDAEVSGADGGLAVDDFSLTANGAVSFGPTVSINQASGQADPTIAGPVLFDVVFSEGVTGFDASDVTIGGTANPTSVSITVIDAAHYTVSVGGMTTSGTVTASIPAGAAQGAYEASAASTSDDNTVEFVAEVVPPSVTINQAIGQADPASTGPVLFDVAFSQDVTGFDASDVTIGGTANPSSVSVAAIDAAHYTVSVSGMTTSGTVTAFISAGAATGVDGATTASTSTDDTVSFVADTAPPVVTINQAEGQADPAAASPVLFDIVFNEDVTGFTASDVTIGGTALPTSAIVQVIHAQHYILSVSGMTASGSVTASIGAGVATDASGNANLASTSADNTIQFVLPAGPPTVTINQSANQPDPTGVGPVLFDVVFSQDVTGFDASDVIIGGTAHPTSKTVQAIDAAHYIVSVGGMTLTGTVTASIAANAATGVDGASTASTSTDNIISFLFVIDVPPVTLSSIAEDSGARLITQAELLSTASAGSSLTAIKLIKVAGNGSLVNNQDGTWSFTPAPNDDTSAVFVYQATADGTTPVVTSATLDITPINDAPVHTVPGILQAERNANKVIAGLGVADVDFKSGIMQTTLSVEHGTLKLASAGGALVFGSGTGTVALIGRPEQIDKTLGVAGNVVYRPTQGFFGTDTLTITSDDGGSSGTGGTLSDTDTVEIVVHKPFVRSDILWQNDDGTPAVWILDGTNLVKGDNVGFNPNAGFTPGQATAGTPPWRVIDSGDFNGDLKQDILWQHKDGTVAEWSVDGTNLLSGGSVDFNPGPTWHALGTGDFNGDGKDDILWQNDDGAPAVWLMDGLKIQSSANVGFNPGPAWHVIDSGDFNGDGKSDILWQNNNGQAAIWLMDGLSVLSGANVGSNPGPTWNVQSAADFNGDGKADILWQNDDGTPAVWLMNGTSVVSSANVGTNPGPTWNVHTAADYNADGKADILWQNDDGTPAVWLMDGTNLVSGAIVGFNPGTTWHVTPPHHDLLL